MKVSQTGMTLWSAATAIENLFGVGEGKPARVQQDGEVVEDVGRLLGDALVALLAGGARGDGALERRERLVRRGGRELPLVEARALARVAGGAVRLHEREDRVGVAVVAQRPDGLDVAGGRPLVPQLVARAAPEVRLPPLLRGGERLRVHVGEGEHLARAPVLHDAGREPALVPGDRAG